ncbi:HMG-box [Linderina pennispora]|uniref:HMG-box n=1 Tax=Linderina pennispora TaxID=61395 RepID=A0A1Y1W2Z0_9FUNG|nr:HMG-box [Linderina pennispora]ORX67921.1 HMG-box [Linderina pennispora]
MYEDRMSMPPMPHASTKWYHIRQPIDYVAPLKKPMNSFLLYSAERRVQLRQTHPDLNTTQQSTILAREWANLAEEEKEKYRAEAKQLRDDYNARRAELSLKLQQQLNQQSLNMSLGHPPPPPPPPPPILTHHPSQGHAPPPLEIIDNGMVPTEHQGHMHPPSPNKQQQQQQTYMGHGLRSPYSPHTPNPSQSHHTPQTQFPQTPQEDIHSHGNVAALASMGADPFQLSNDISSLAHSESDMASSQMFKFDHQHINQGYQDADQFGKQLGEEVSGKATGEDRWQQSGFSLTNDAFQDSVHMPYNLPRPPSSLPTDLNTMSADPASLTHDRPSQPIQPSDPASAQAGMSRSRLRVSSPPKRARKKSKKDPDAPKHPMSAFLYFLTTERPRLADQLSEMSIGQQTKIIAKKWKCLTDSERAPWERLAKNDKDRYARERREYHGEGRNSATPAAQN